MAKARRWNNVQEALADLMQHCDDFESFKIRAHSGQWKAGNHQLSGAFCEVQFCDGSSTLISLDVAEALINEGILSRLRIPFRLVPHADQAVDQ